MTSYDLSSQSGSYDQLTDIKQDVLALAFRKRRYSTAGTLDNIQASVFFMMNFLEYLPVKTGAVSKQQEAAL